jgi:hypothetical protein
MPCICTNGGKNVSIIFRASLILAYCAVIPKDLNLTLCLFHSLADDDINELGRSEVLSSWPDTLVHFVHICDRVHFELEC